MGEQKALGERGVIQAAGGLLRRESPGGRQVAVVHRSRYDDWTLPKGKLKEGEDWDAAALREVRQESGYDAELRGFAGSVSYTVEGRPKVVLFWHMVARGESFFQPSEEVAEVAWLSVPEATARLDYPGERRLLGSDQPMAATRSPERPRLAGVLFTSRTRLDSMVSLVRTQGYDVVWADAAYELLGDTEGALAVGDVDSAWRLLTAAKRMTLLGVFAAGCLGDDLGDAELCRLSEEFEEQHDGI